MPIFDIKKFSTTQIALTSVMVALVCVSTLIIRIPVPATGGYINIGDVMIFVSALTFGKGMGFFSGGIGSAIADIIGGYPTFALLTFIVKGTEGFLAGIISNGKDKRRDILAIIVGGTTMILGYYIGEAFFMGFGTSAAFVEVPGNFVQILAGGILSFPISIVIRRYVKIS